ncbi:hypothetical protein [Tuwongella immobilis]|uniref:Uncharacterized protein n=1 Tax=Tuwongella immobilis TaxID=692036 RepID=A0A6C2YJZ4_9BACT|nr:hypothetical protein [Tuwongella immobilis]VIP01549.1 Uncharacterized protein OS=Planctomyces maris DSM 8797 GN=PM8797T_18239 PE=4 SV=1 [Tuwongella immobilis]VTR98738.1 Uncharacterized protein OS=Planctomyces maris DSM 8797 GN=PM8797T_18239 PE=4 SV=1 [Tuwongella immobilis]
MLMAGEALPDPLSGDDLDDWGPIGMDSLLESLLARIPVSSLLGYLNFSDGRPDHRWQAQINDVYRAFLESGDPAPWQSIPRWLLSECLRLEAAGNAAFRDSTQVKAVIQITFNLLIPQYQQHHRDLLAHQQDAVLLTPLFLARACEAVLAQGGPWDETKRIVTGAIQRLNDFVGHRPIAMLETRQQTEFYPHEKVRPIPLMIPKAGVSAGRYDELITRAMEILKRTPPDLLQEACFPIDQLEEIALDPRAYDHQHPANRRPNYLFGEWDPHAIDSQGRYRRFVLRQNTLDAMLQWLPATTHPQYSEKFDEAAVVLVAILLMAAGVSGSGPTNYDSNVTLTKLVPKIARYRDRFYAHILETFSGAHLDRLRQEAKQLRQPFAGVRAHLNQALAQQRAYQLQERVLSLLFAEMGYPAASRERAARIPTASVRILSEIYLRQTAARLALERDQARDVPAILAEIEQYLQRGIACGALPDPWNILGFQGLFPLFSSREDSVRDTRHEELITLIGRQFSLYAETIAALALRSGDDVQLRSTTTRAMEQLATWWDQFATPEVSDLPRVHGGERIEAALRVAQALADWQNRPAGTNDLQFWRRQRDGFRSTAAFAQVVEAMLQHQELPAAFALLMTWLSESDSLPLEEAETSFHILILQWFTRFTAQPATAFERQGLTIARIFELLEANADILWQVPEFQGSKPRRNNKSSPDNPDTDAEVDEDGDEDMFGAAYESMIYRDSTDDGNDSSLAGDGPISPTEFPLEEEAANLERRLEFIRTVAILWQRAASYLYQQPQPDGGYPFIADWWGTASRLQSKLVALIQDLHSVPVPEPLGGFEAVVEYDRRRAIQESVIDMALHTCVQMRQAERALGALQFRSQPDAPLADEANWTELALRLESAILRGDVPSVRRLLGQWRIAFSREPLLFVPLAAGGAPQPILRARTAQSFLRFLLERLPRLGLLRETFHLVKVARQMEQNETTQGRRVTEFDRLFRIALQSVVESLLASAVSWQHDDESEQSRQLTELLRRIADSFLTLWMAHSQTLRLSVLESVSENGDWERLKTFIKTYGRDLFTVQFLALANLRGILTRGVVAHLERMLDQIDQAPASRLLQDLEANRIGINEAARPLETVISALVEHYDEYRDYNATTAQSDYGDNLFQLLDFLRLKVRYERYAWRLRPMVLAHEILCRRGHDATADRWRDSIRDFTLRLSNELHEELAKLESQYGIKLRTIRDRIDERFVQPLLLDRLCALIAPAMKAVGDVAAEQDAFQRFEEQLRPFEAAVPGTGLETPHWLRQLEQTVRKVRESISKPSDELAAEQPFDLESLPIRKLTLEELNEQLTNWDSPLEADEDLES